MHVYDAKDVKRIREELNTDVFTAKTIAWKEGMVRLIKDTNDVKELKLLMIEMIEKI